MLYTHKHPTLLWNKTHLYSITSKNRFSPKVHSVPRFAPSCIPFFAQQLPSNGCKKPHKENNLIISNFQCNKFYTHYHVHSFKMNFINMYTAYCGAVHAFAFKRCSPWGCWLQCTCTAPRSKTECRSSEPSVSRDPLPVWRVRWRCRTLDHRRNGPVEGSILRLYLGAGENMLK